jgi:hypothetical protein
LGSVKTKTTVRIFVKEKILKLFIIILIVAVFAGILQELRNWLIYKYKLTESWYYIRNTGSWFYYVKLQFIIYFFVTIFYFYTIKLLKKKYKLSIGTEIIFSELIILTFYFIILATTFGFQGLFISTTYFILTLLCIMLPPIILSVLIRNLK